MDSDVRRLGPWPDYGDGGLLGLVSSFSGFLKGEAWWPPGATTVDWSESSGRSLVFLLIDGLGDYFLQRFGADSVLAAHRQGRLTSVFPSTTSAAVTTTMTGLSPAQHGLTGWFVRDERFGGVLAPLPMRRRGGGEIDAPFAVEQLFPYPNLYEGRPRPAMVVSPREIAWSRFSKHHARGARIAGYGNGLQGLVDAVVQGVTEVRKAGGGFIHAYYPVFDSVSHEFGSTSPEAIEEFKRVDQAFAMLLERLSGLECDVVATADHGFTDAVERRSVWLEEYPELAALLECPLWGERRAAFCAVRKGREAEFEAIAAQVFAGKAVVARSADLVEAGLFGPAPRHPRLAERVGTHTLLMEPGWVVVDQVPGEHPYWLTGVHGGLSSEEMWIPLIRARC